MGAKPWRSSAGLRCWASVLGFGAGLRCWASVLGFGAGLGAEVCVERGLGQVCARPFVFNTRSVASGCGRDVFG